MYGWIWRKLPFGLPGKIIGSLLLITAAVWVLWYHVFPRVEPLLPFDDVQVTSDQTVTPSSVTSSSPTPAASTSPTPTGN